MPETVGWNKRCRERRNGGRTFPSDVLNTYPVTLCAAARVRVKDLYELQYLVCNVEPALRGHAPKIDAYVYISAVCLIDEAREIDLVRYHGP